MFLLASYNNSHYHCQNIITGEWSIGFRTKEQLKWWMAIEFGTHNEGALRWKKEKEIMDSKDSAWNAKM